MQKRRGTGSNRTVGTQEIAALQDAGLPCLTAFVQNQLRCTCRILFPQFGNLLIIIAPFSNSSTPVTEHCIHLYFVAPVTLNRQDFDPQRESRPGVDIARASPPQLPAELLRSSDRLRLDLLKAEADRYPAQYRAFVEAYLRALNGSRR